MATTDVPGAKAANLDELAVGCWAEDEQKTSLLHVIGTENGQVVFQMYDLTDGMYYQDAMLEDDFEQEFSFPPTGKSPVRWTWHDKTTFPWDRVMSRFKRPVPQPADVQDTLSAAQKIAKALHLRGRKLTEADVGAQGGTRRSIQDVLERIATSLEKLAQ